MIINNEIRDGTLALQEEAAKIPQAGQKGPPEKPESIPLVAPHIAPNEEIPLKQPPLAESTQYLTSEQENALADFLGSNPDKPFNQSQFLSELEDEKGKL